jgi:hypothetical protein
MVVNPKLWIGLLLVLAISAPDIILAAPRFARTSGNWSALTWSGTSCTTGTAAVPTAADAVTICDNVTVTVNTSPTVQSITIPAGANDSILQITSAQILTVTGNVTVTAGTGTGDDKVILLSNNAVFNVNGNVTLNGNGNDDRIALLQINGASATIDGNLIIDGIVAGNDRARVTLANTSSLTVNGDITLGLGGLLDNGNTTNSIIRLRGDFTQVGASNDYSSTGGVFQIDGAGAQALNGGAAVVTTFYRLIVNKTAGDVTLGHDVGVAGGAATSQLLLTQGRILTGANSVAIGAAGATATTISGASTASYVVGNLRRYIPTGTQTGIVYPVGGSTAGKYAPAQIDFPNVTTAGYFQVAASTANTDHPSIASSMLDPANSVNRYWTLTNTGGITFSGATTASATFNYPASDVDGSADPSTFIVGNFSGGAWTYPTTGTLTSTNTQATGLTAAAIAGDYALGDMGGPFSYWRMNENAWNGTANEVADFGSTSNPGTAAGLSATKPTTSSTTPAIAGTPGTCRYGVFNRANKDYLALPGSYPNLTATGSPGFSITAWIRTTDSTLPGQRIFIDDEANATPGGWGFSVGETDRAGAGGLRFYYRQAATATIDTVAIPSNQWLFVALSVSLATGTGASRATLYAYNTAGTLVTTYTDVFTWTPGSDAGPSSIGGETNASGEGTNQFGFSGNIDELRVYRGPLSQGMINQVRQLVNPCILTDHYAIIGGTTGVTCEASAITIRAHDAAHALVSPLAGTVLTLTMSPATAVWQAGLNSGTGGWAPSGSSATYTWPGGESIFSVNLRKTVVGTVNINLSDINGKTESAGEDLSIAFVDSALRVTDGTGAPVNIGTQISGKDSDVGFGAQALRLQAIRTDTNTGSCAGLIPGQTVTVEMAAARINPTGGLSAVSVKNSASSFVTVGTGAGAAGTYTALTLSFDAQSMAPLVFNYADAGSIALFARYQLPSPPASTYISGSSNTFVVRPFAMHTVVTGNPGVNTPSGAVFTSAGTNFSATVRAVAWQAADDANNDGIPDSGANLSDNATTQNFAYATVLTAAAPYQPSAGTLGALNNGSLAAGAFASGIASPTTLQYTEVGSFSLTTAVTDYLGDANADVVGLPIVVGRFTPHHFSVAKNTPSFDAACLSTLGAFSYVGQSFGYTTGQAPTATVTAANALGGTTKNYTGSWRRLSNADLLTLPVRYAAFTGTLDPLTLPNVASDPVIVDLTGASLGLFTLTFSSGAGFRFTRPAPVVPFDADIGLSVNIIDVDGIASTSNPLAFGAATPAGNGILFNGVGSTPKQMRFGRLTLSNAFGSDRLDLPIPMEAQYYATGGIYKTNAEDTCTSILPSNVFLSSGVATGGGPLAAGKGNLKITKPGSPVSIDLCVDLDGTPPLDGSCVAATPANQPWLQWKWTGSTYDKDPKAKATFGLFKSADEFIYLREMF